jgi:hypothetical protein
MPGTRPGMTNSGESALFYRPHFQSDSQDDGEMQLNLSSTGVNASLTIDVMKP